jgi:hypothetical protein
VAAVAYVSAEGSISPRLRRVLEARRETWNAEVARYGAAIPPASMLGFLRRTVDPILAGLGGEAGDGVADAVARALFSLALPAIPMGMIGERAATPFEEALVALLPRLGEHLRGAPHRVVPAAGNGYLRMWRERGEPTARWWLEGLAHAAPIAATHEQLLAAGVVLAWRAGLAEARTAALDHLAAMPVPLREALTGATQIDPDPLRRFVRLGSRAPLGPLGCLARVGAFSGFGGDFRLPPVVRAVDGHLLATDGVNVRVLHADVFGVRLRSAALAAASVLEAGSGAEPVSADPAGRVRWGELEVRDAALRGATSAAVAEGVVAVTVADSHAVLVLGRREAAP